MKHSLNNYLHYIGDRCTRLEIYPYNEIAAKLVSEYRERGVQVVPGWKLITGFASLPRPINLIKSIRSYAEKSQGIVLFIGLDAYLALIDENDRRDFFIGIRGFLDDQKFPAHFLVSSTYFPRGIIRNPKYEDAMYLIHFHGYERAGDLKITLIPSEWVQNDCIRRITKEAMQEMGVYIPSGTYMFTMDERDLPATDYGNVHVVRDAKEALREIYGVGDTFDDINSVQAGKLLRKCKAEGKSPDKVIADCFDGAADLTCDGIALKLIKLRNDELWDLYIFWLKSKLPKDTYLFKVLQRDVTAENFLEEYVVNAAISLLDDKNIKVYAKERAIVVKEINGVEPLVAKFVKETEKKESSLYFMNCGMTAEMEGIIRRAARYDLMVELPSLFDTVASVLKCYLSPNFDYGYGSLTEYFSRLRAFRVKDFVDDEFVAEARNAKVPKEIKKRDEIIGTYDDGETALLVVDGLGAEYYPLLINLAKLNNLNIQEKQLVAVNLPTSTSFNAIAWNKERELEQVKGIDDISHSGHSKYEKCGYEENLAETFALFQKRILSRVVNGLDKYKRVLVTADHGSSYLAVTAHKAGKSITIPWKDPDDWRYTSLIKAKDCPEDLEPVYRPDDGRTYYVVKGYNRLPKSGGKLYGLHGGATLEERLVPFVVFTKEAVPETSEEDVETLNQITENDDFDI